VQDAGQHQTSEHVVCALFLKNSEELIEVEVHNHRLNVYSVFDQLMVLRSVETVVSS
jgi:hypothetical protein